MTPAQRELLTTTGNGNSMNRVKALAACIALSLASSAFAADEVKLSASYEYDDLGRVVLVRNGDGAVVNAYTYDADGNRLTAKDAVDRQTVMTYDALHRAATLKDPSGKITSLAYDADGNLVEVKDPRDLRTQYAYDGFGAMVSSVSPDSGTTSLQYEAYGLLRNIVRNDGSQVSFGYDALGRRTSEVSADSSRTFAYDSCENGAGRLCSANTPTVAKSFGYTPQGLLSSQSQTWNGKTDSAAFVYDGLGRVTGISYPGGVSVGYGYTGGELRLMQVTTNGVTSTVVSNTTYRPFGPIDGWTYGNELERIASHDVNGRVFALSAGTAQSIVQSLTYQFNAANEITAVTNGLDATQNGAYQYDALGRLSADTAEAREWKYDGNGNRTVSVSATGTTSYVTDSGSNRLLNYTGAQSRTMGHDALGNRSQEVGVGYDANYAYDGFNGLRSATVNGVSSEYFNDALGLRVAKRTPQGDTRFVTVGGNQLLGEFKSTGWKSYLWLGSDLVGVVTPNGQVSYVHTDQVGRPEVVTNSARQVVWRADNDVYGRSVKQDAIGGLAIGFPGQYFDEETGLWNNGLRVYDAFAGRYLQTDPLGLAGGISLYAYANGNPTRYVDPMGLAGLLISGSFSANLTLLGGTGSTGFFIGTGGWGFVYGGGAKQSTNVDAGVGVSIGGTAASKPSDLAGLSASMGAAVNAVVLPVSANVEVSNLCPGCKPVYSIGVGGVLKLLPFELYTAETYTKVGYAQEEADTGEAIVIVDGEEVSRETFEIKRPASRGGGGGGVGGGGGGCGPIGGTVTVGKVEKKKE